ncbi:MAG: CocE/NonD family hydrolase [Actinobacteria bacterium]|nr:CocE/NonD family hydrolase [Actinomycetota bacterium]
MDVKSQQNGAQAGAGERVEVLYRKARPVTDPVGRYPGFRPGTTTLKAGTVVKPGHRALTCDVLFERDVAVQLRDGITIYTDVFRPVDGRDLPAIVAWSPYGKEMGNTLLDDIPFRAGVPKAACSGLEKFEGPDPAYWCAHGYAIVNPDSRGAYMSEGDIYFWGTQEAQDGYDLIEWVAAQHWSNGKVGMAGNSWLAIVQWFIAAQRPPHLAAIAPWEGHMDMYCLDVYRGGIPDVGFCDSITDRMCGLGRVEDVPAMVRRYPFMNEYWTDKRARPERIEVPAYVVGSWTNPIHTVGTFQAFEDLVSSEKWLRVHNAHEWPDFYAYQDDLRRFFDRYLRGLENGWESTPPVRLSILDPGGKDEVDRPESEFPPARTEYRRLYLAAGGAAVGGRLSYDPPAEERSARYAADEKGRAHFTLTFDHDTELCGHLKLRLWVEAQGANDMDLFIKIQKLSRRGRLLFSPTIRVPNPILRKVLPLAFRGGVKQLSLLFFTGGDGRLRVSRRALDPERSTEEQPYLTHDHDEMLGPGEIVPVEIGLRPIGTRWRAGEQLRLVVAGYNLSPMPFPGMTQPELMNSGTHVIHTGGRYDSHLLVPVTPPQH